MVLSKFQFFLLLLALLLCIFFAHKLVWLLTARKTTGEVVMTGHGNLGSVLGISSYQVVRFVAQTDTIIFNGDIDLELEEGSEVSVLYHVSNPQDAKINSFKAIWADSMVYCIGPLLVLIAVFLMPDIIPNQSKIIISMKGLRLSDKAD